MKNLRHTPRVLAALAAALFITQPLHAAVTTWNSTGGNWSLGANWTAGAPGTADDAIFGNVGAGTPTTMDASRTINSLLYNQDNQSTHTTTINSGQTLTITRTTAGDPFTANSTSAGTTAATLLPVAISGAGGTLTVSGTGDFVVRQGNGTAGAHMATVDMSGLDTFNATIGRLLVGQANAGAAVNRPSGTLILAKTNHITLSGAAPTVMVQDSGSNANGSLVSVLTFGQVNTLFGSDFRFGGQKGNGTINFNASLTGPSLVIRNTDGVSRSTQLACGDNSFAASGNSTVANMDLTLGTVDILVDTVYIGRGNPGGGTSTGQSTGTLGVSAGTFDINTLEIAFQVATVNNGICTGTLNVNTNSTIGAAAVVKVNSNMRLARTNGSSGAVTGTLNINGGTVMANAITAGGGNSTISLAPSSTLVISNTAGSLSAPIRTFNIQNSILTLPALNAGSVLAVTTLNASGANLINISAIPPIGSYPATFTLISCQSGAAVGTFTLNSLPPASPSYAGSLIDLGNGLVQLQLTAGPVVDLSLRWTGSTDNNWDTTTFNWLYQGNSSNFFSGSAAVFNDSSTQTNVNLVTALSPGTVTVSNNTVQYDFAGPGNIAGASLLAKKGSKTLIVENQGVNNFGNVTILGGTLQLGSGDTNGDITTLNIANSGALVVNRSGTVALSANINGSGSLTKLGNGTLTLSGADTYSGTTTLTGGGLQVNSALSGGGSLTTASGTSLGGSGSVSGAITAAGSINPGTVNGPGTLTAGAGLTLSSGSTLTFDLSGTDPFTPAVNDSIAITGNLNLNNNKVTANFLGVPNPGNPYPIMTYSGTLGGSFNPTVSGTHFTVALDTISSPGTVFLNITGGSGANLKWSSGSDSAWDSIATNWTDLDSSAPSQFFSGDTVLLNDDPVQTAITIGSGITVYPSVITNISDGNSFTISGAGKISGTASIVKAGQSALTLSTPNDFSGTVDVQAGTLRIGNGSALGNTTAGTLVESNATLDFNGISIGAETLTVSGPGFNNSGAVINSGGIQNTALRTMVLAGDTSFGGSGNWAINNQGGAASLSTGGQPYKLTKVGGNLVGLQNLTTVDAALGDIEVQQGILEFNGLTPSMGDPAHTNIVDSGATLQFTSDTVVWNKFFNLNGNGSTTTVNNNTSANTELAGPIEMHGGVVFNVGGTAFSISSVISGDGSLIKNGGTAMILSNANTYTGDTMINVAALRLNNIGSISNSLNVVIASGATLTVTGRVDATFTVAPGQTLSGNGTINGNLTGGPGSTIAPGISAVGALTMSNSIVLAGTNIMELNQDASTNDVLRSNGGITYGGVLNLVNLGSPLTNGASFKLYNAATYGGAFASIDPPTPGAGQAWNTNTLSSGIISVVSTVTGPTTNATITSTKLSGTNIVLHGTNNNVPNTSFHYVVLASTNLSIPLSNWTGLSTNPFSAGGTFDYTNPIVPSQPRQFLNIKAVP